MQVLSVDLHIFFLTNEIPFKNGPLVLYVFTQLILLFDILFPVRFCKFPLNKIILCVKIKNKILCPLYSPG